MSMTLEVSLSRGSIDAAVKALEEYADSIPERCDEAASNIAQDGLDAAKQNLAAWPQPFATGELAGSFFKMKDVGTWLVGNSSAHAAFFEFGTGVRGASSGYPFQLPEGISWQYDSNGHGEAGWRYLGDDGEYHWTAGLPSRPFMAQAAQTMRNSEVQRFKEAFAR